MAAMTALVTTEMSCKPYSLVFVFKQSVTIQWEGCSSLMPRGTFRNAVGKLEISAASLPLRPDKLITSPADEAWLTASIQTLRQRIAIALRTLHFSYSFLTAALQSRNDREAAVTPVNTC